MASNFSSWRVSSSATRRTLGSTTSWKALRASTVSPNISTRACGIVPGGVGVDQLGRLGDGHAVAPPDEGVALDHGRQGRVHPARAERDHLAVAGRPFAPRRLGSDAGGLAEETEQGRLVLGPLDIRSLDHHDRLIGAEDGALVHRPHVHGQAFEQPGRLLDTGEDPERPVRLGEALEANLGLDARVESSRRQDLDRAGEIDVGHLPGFDLGLGGDVKSPRMTGHSGLAPGGHGARPAWPDSPRISGRSQRDTPGP